MFQFIQATQEEWEMLDLDAVDRSIDCMNKRVQQVLKKHGNQQNSKYVYKYFHLFFLFIYRIVCVVVVNCNM
jgi:hypothetical protein